MRQSLRGASDLIKLVRVEFMVNPGSLMGAWLRWSLLPLLTLKGPDWGQKRVALRDALRVLLEILAKHVHYFGLD